MFLITILKILLLVQLITDLELIAEKEIRLLDSSQEVFQASFAEMDIGGDVIYFSTGHESEVTAFSLQSGEQLFYKNLLGNGPFELENVYAISASDEAVYLTSYNGKVVGLNHSGEPIYEAMTREVRIKNTAVSGSSIFLANESPGTGNYVNGYNMENREKIGLPPEQEMRTVLFSPFKFAGFATTFEGNIFYGKPNSQTIHKYQTTERKSKKIELSLPGFRISEMDSNPEIYFNDISRLQQFIVDNSTISGLFKAEDGWIIEVVHMYDNMKRMLFYFNPSFKLLCYGNVPPQLDGTSSPGIRFGDGHHLYYYKEVQTDDDSTDKFIIGFKPGCS